MSADLKALLELQKIDLELMKEQKALAALDDGAGKRKQVEAARTAREEAERLLNEAASEMQDKDLTLKTVETKQKTFKDKLYGGTVTSPKELESMEKEIEMLGRQKGTLEERILELMDIVEERKSALGEAEKVLERQEAELTALIDKLQTQRKALSSTIEELSSKREQALPAVPAGLMKRYESMRARAGGVVVSVVEAERCSACHTQIMGGVMRILKSDDGLETCENCGRLLYLEQ